MVEGFVTTTVLATKQAEGGGGRYRELAGLLIGGESDVDDLHTIDRII